jgi:hypothetical protein
MTVVIGGTREEIPGIASVCWLDGNPKVKYVTDKKKRERVCRGIVCHTHEGVLGELLEGLGPNTTMDERLAMYQTQTDRIVSWDWTQDQNGDVTWQNDPLVDYTFHGNQVCDVTVGFELIQKVRRNSKGEVVGGDLYSGQIAAAVLMIDFITARLGIQRQIPWDKKRNRPVRGVVGRIAAGGGDVVGIYGHRNITTNRGAGDPGDAIFFALRDAGYELFDLNTEEDLKTWKLRQQQLGFTDLKDLDGVPLTKTVAALKNKGHRHGMWVKRPVDDLIQER